MAGWNTIIFIASSEKLIKTCAKFFLKLWKNMVFIVLMNKNKLNLQ